MRGWRNLNIRINTYDIHLILDSSRKIFGLWCLLSSLLFQGIGHRLVKNTKSQDFVTGFCDIGQGLAV